MRRQNRGLIHCRLARRFQPQRVRVLSPFLGKANMAGVGLFLSLIGCSVIGCQGNDPAFHPVPKGAKVAEPAHSHEHGPHGGHLVELGNEEYHAEVVFDKPASKLTVYLLDSTAKKYAPTDTKQITLNLLIEGKFKSIALAAAPQAGDPSGQSSRFEVAGNPEIKANVKDEEDLKGNVSATIAGKAFSGDIKHEH